MKPQAQNKPTTVGETAIETKDLSIFYDEKEAVKQTNIQIKSGTVTAIIGPSGCGKSTLLRSFNRMNDLVPAAHHTGQVLVNGKDIYSDTTDPVELRRTVGMVFQRPNPFPKSIYKNIIWGPKVNKMKYDADSLVETCLRKAALWDEVKDRLHSSAFDLSGGQQQRLCIARTIAMNPEIILMDEPCSALDPGATAKIEDLIHELSESYTIAIVTHNMQQAARVSEETLFFYNGELIEAGLTDVIFTNPTKKKTEDYISGRFG